MEQELTLNDVKRIQLDMLDYLDCVCKKYNIKYYLSSGTLLGAIRHKGYIPWDDDIDISVRREDYDRLLEVLEKNNTRFKILSLERNAEYFYLFAKLVDSYTVLKEKGVWEIPGMGVYIDIFPLDYLPENDIERKKVVDRIFFYRHVLYYALLTAEQRKNVSLIQKIKCFLGKLYGWKRALNKVDKMCRNASAQYKDYMAEIVANTKKNIYMKKEVYDSVCTAEFEGKYYSIPGRYRDYLEVSYGEYMKLPPQDERVLKHGFKAYKKMDIIN